MTQREDDPLAALGPSPDALLDFLRPQVDDDMLRQVASADYGEDAHEHLRALRGIRDTAAVPAPLEWCPKEVLELTRWSEPGEPSEPDAAPPRGHLARAFCCAALLRAACEPGNADVDFFCEADTLAQLLGSALALGPRAEEAALRFAAWRVAGPGGAGYESESDRAFFALAVVLLAAGPAGQARGDGWLRRVCWWAVGPGKVDGVTGSGWGYGGLRYKAWQRLAARVAGRTAWVVDAETRELLQAVVGLIVH